MASCKHCGLSDNSMPILTDIDDLSTTSTEELWAIVQTFDTEIARMETLLNGLVIKRALLKKTINHHSSPLIRIPSDITSEIFKAYLNKERETEGGVPSWRGGSDSGGAFLTPLFLGSISSAWRELVWSMPWMWSSVALEVTEPFPNCASLLDEWLLRSGQCALTISLRCDVDHRHKNTAQEVISVVARFSERWRHITFDLPSSYFGDLYSIKGHLPLLESMCVRLLGWSRFEDADLFRMFSVAPQLKVVQYSGFPPNSIIIPLAQLTSLSGYESDIGGCLEVLEVAPQLTYASLIVNLPPFSTNPCQVLAPRLQSLEFDADHDARSTSMLLDNLNLPNLRELRLIAGGRQLEFFGDTSFSSFILRSACPLRFLSFIGYPLHDEDLLRCMQVVPSLEVLLIHGSDDITEQTIRNLTPNMTSDLPLLPNLQELSISSGGLVIDAFELHSMLSARWRQGDACSSPGVTQLRSVTISAGGRDGEMEPALLLLQEFITEGMRISLLIM